ncbi:MAG: hypothetical protein HUU37_00455 [Bdellovibrionales bacterium]|nr:hypothetical protein [Bdellovibrionales bacterium]
MLEVSSRPAESVKGVDAGAVLSGDDVQSLLGDPATFALIHHVFSRAVWPMRELYESAPEELHVLLDTLIARLCDRRVAEVSNGNLISSKRYFFAFDNRHLSKFLPLVFEIGVEAVLTEKPGVPGRRVDYLAIPDTEASARAMRTAAQEYLAKLRMIQAEAMASAESDGAPVRFVGLLSNVIHLKEFV